MRGCTLLFSDIHADIGALDVLLKVASDPAFVARFGPVERTVNLGDVVERGYHPCEVIVRLASLANLISVLGNHDEAFIHDSPVSGSDGKSITASELCRGQGTWKDFFEGMGTSWADKDDRIFAVHGGPVDSATVCPPGADRLTAWLYSGTWQRISRDGQRFFDGSGYHYTPEDAFASVRKVLKPGFVIFCGHEHAEAAFVENDFRGVDILQVMKKTSFTIKGKRVDEKSLSLKDDRNYLIRLGIAGPEGYYEHFGWDRCYFGVYREKDGQRTVSLLSFQLGRDMMPP